MRPRLMLQPRQFFTLTLLMAVASSWTSALQADPIDEKDPKKSTKEATTKKGDKEDSKKSEGDAQGVDMSSVPADEKIEKAALKALGDGFKIKRTAHYSIIYDTSDEDLKSFTIAIEKTYRSAMNYSIKLGIPTRKPAKKLPIYYFNEHKRYNDYSVSIKKGPRPQNNPGVFFPDLQISMFYNMRDSSGLKQHIDGVEKQIEQLNNQLRGRNVSVEQKKQIREQIKALRTNSNVNKNIGGSGSETTVQHEVSHQVLWNIGFHNPDQFFANPRWLAEGTAQLFETISTGKSSNVGAVNKSRLKAYRALEAAKKLFPLKDFVSSARFFEAPDDMQIAYPESWALVHYLNRVKRDELRAYVAILNKRPVDYEPKLEQELKDFEKAFGKLDAKWEKKWQQWMKQVR